MKTMLKLISYASVLMLLVWIASCNSQPSKPGQFNYVGISFEHDSNWKTETEVLTPAQSYYMDCEKEGDHSEIFIITVQKDEISAKELINAYLGNMSEQADFTSSEIAPAKFGKYDCLAADYSFSLPGMEFFGTVYAIREGSKSITMIKQTDSKNALKNEFIKIERSFEISPSWEK